MAAKTIGTWRVVDRIGVEALTDIGTTALHKLGTRVRAWDVNKSTQYGWGEFIYLAGLDNTVAGTVVLIKDDYSTSLLAKRDKGAVALALAACVTGYYGWYQIRGQGVATSADVAANVPCYIDQATDGSVDDDAVAGEQIIGMRTVTEDDTSTVVVNMATYPAVADFDNSTAT